MEWGDWRWADNEVAETGLRGSKIMLTALTCVYFQSLQNKVRDSTSLNSCFISVTGIHTPISQRG